MKIPEYKVCAASAIRAAQKPEWAKDVDVEELAEARRRRHELPIAQAKATPVMK